jgi:hypothetical protein
MGHCASNKKSSAVISPNLALSSRNVHERKLRKCANKPLKVAVIEGGRLAWQKLRASNMEHRFQVLKATAMTLTVLWDVLQCNVVTINLRFRGAYCPIVGATFLLRIREVSGSSLHPDTGHPDKLFRVFFFVLARHIAVSFDAA